MLSVCWNEDKEGCLVAVWSDHDNADRGGFVEAPRPIDEVWEEDEFSAEDRFESEAA